MEVLRSFWAEVVRVWNTGVFGADLGEVFLGLLILTAFVFGRGAFTRLIVGSLKRLTARTSTDVDDMFLAAIEKPLRFVFVVVGLSVAVHVAGIDGREQVWVGMALRSLIAFTIFWAVYNIVGPLSFLINRLLIRIQATATAREALRSFFLRLLRIVIIALGIAAVLQEWGFNVAAVLGGLGLVGMAVALAAKDIVSNLFSGMMIFLNRIFETGNWIKTPSVEGVVEHVGLMTTQVRQFDKALVTVSNSQLTGEPITNYARMTNRRIYWKIGLEYRTTQDQLRRVVAGIRDYIQSNEAFETDPKKVSTFVVVDAFAGSSIDIMLYCFTKTTNWGEWLAIKEALALEIKAIVEGNGAGFAFPSTSLYVEQLPLGEAEAFPAAAAGLSAAAEQQAAGD
ncbi:MAG: mechanosensitive ion channel family protein [Kiloniellales bacterium]|nr:mechanosensitive ion channel family protein [Kiloniellales bacterium]